MKAKISCVIILSGILAIFSACDRLIDNGWDKEISVRESDESDCTNVSVTVSADGSWFGRLYKGGEEEAIRAFTTEDISTIEMERRETYHSIDLELGPVEPFTEYWYVAGLLSPENTILCTVSCRIYFDD